MGFYRNGQEWEEPARFPRRISIWRTLNLYVSIFGETAKAAVPNQAAQLEETGPSSRGNGPADSMEVNVMRKYPWTITLTLRKTRTTWSLTVRISKAQTK